MPAIHLGNLQMCRDRRSFGQGASSQEPDEHGQGGRQGLAQPETPRRYRHRQGQETGGCAKGVLCWTHIDCTTCIVGSLVNMMVVPSQLFPHGVAVSDMDTVCDRDPCHESRATDVGCLDLNSHQGSGATCPRLDGSPIIPFQHNGFDCCHDHLG